MGWEARRLMPIFMLADHVSLAWVDDTDELTDYAIEQMAAWSFWWHDDRNMVMLVDDEN